MPLENASLIHELIDTNPDGSDQGKFADDHLRMIKKSVLGTFPNITGAVSLTHDVINAMPSDIANVSGEVSTLVNAIANDYYDKTESDLIDAQNVKLTTNQAIGGVKSFTDSPTAPTPISSDDSTKLATTSFVQQLVQEAVQEATAQFFGVNQTWQNVTSSRKAGVTYTNNTSKPIYVSIRQIMSNWGANSLYVDDILISTTGSKTGVGYWAQMEAIVPPGSTYKMGTDLVRSFQWNELR